MLTIPDLITPINLSICLFFLSLAVVPNDAEGQERKASHERQASEAIRAQVVSDEELDRLEKEKKKAEYQQGIAEAQRKTFEAKLPKTEYKPPEGKTTVDSKDSMEIKVLAHEAIENITRQINLEIKSYNEGKAENDKIKKLLIYTEQEAASLYYYEALLEQIKSLSSRYETVIAAGEADFSAQVAPFLASPETAGSVLRSLLDVVALFQSNVDIKAQAVSVEEVSLVSMLIDQARSLGLNMTVIYPKIYLSGLNSQSTLLGQLKQLGLKREASERLVLENKPENAAKIAALKALNAQHDTILAGLYAVDTTTRLNSLTVLLKVEALHNHLEDGHMLFLKTMAAGGNSRVVENFFTKVFWHASLSFNGGGIVTYVIFARDGSVLLARTLHDLGPYKRPCEITNNFSRPTNDTPPVAALGNLRRSQIGALDEKDRQEDTGAETEAP